jgi:colicin import membrane protein
MNALVSIDVATLTPASVFAPGGMEGIISKLEAEVRAIDRDITTPEGRDAVKSLAYKVARSKTALDDMGKELVADIKKQAGAIDADRKLARDRLDALKEEVRGPLTQWEEAEANRISGHEGARPRASRPASSAS